MAGQPEHLYDVAAYEIGTPVEGEQLCVAVRFQLRDGSFLGFALPPEIAAGLALEITGNLRKLAERPDPASH